MSKATASPGFLLHGLGDIARDFPVHAAILDRFGVIVAVNDQWKRFGESNGLTLADHGVGQNYLRYCAFADPLSPRLIRGFSQVLSGDINRFSFVYGDGGGDDSVATRHLLLAFPHPESPNHFVVMHIDVTVLVSVFSLYQTDVMADEMLGDLLATPATAVQDQPARAVEQALLMLGDEAGDRGTRNRRHGQRGEFREPQTPPLSKRQLEVLSLMAKGMTNAEIADALGLSLNTVKVYVSGILARLGLQSRAQVLHWVLTRRRGDVDF